MLRALLRQLTAWRTSRRLEREITPAVFLRLAEEIRSLACCAALSCPDTDISAISSDIDQIARTATSTEFRSLSIENRLTLRREMIRSRQQLMDSLQEAARPTRFVQ